MTIALFVAILLCTWLIGCACGIAAEASYWPPLVIALFLLAADSIIVIVWLSQGGHP